MANRQTAFVRQVREPNPAGEILLEQLDGAAFSHGSQSRGNYARRFL